MALAQRVLVLFAVGMLTILLVALLLEDNMLVVIKNPALLCISSALSSVSVGLIVPLIDNMLQINTHKAFDFIRCTGGFIGLVLAIIVCYH